MTIVIYMIIAKSLKRGKDCK